MAEKIVRQYRYFLYSEEQYKLRKEVEKEIGLRYIPGTVLVDGIWREFTELSKDYNNRYADCKVVAEGYLDDINYKENSNIWGHR